jgi:hypothetical protein
VIVPTQSHIFKRTPANLLEGDSLEVLFVLYKSGLPTSRVIELFNERAGKYREVKGLLQKLYIHDESTDPCRGHLRL